MAHLQTLLRNVHTSPDDAHNKGLIARRDMIQHYSLPLLALKVRCDLICCSCLIPFIIPYTLMIKHPIIICHHMLIRTLSRSLSHRCSFNNTLHITSVITSIIASLTSSYHRYMMKYLVSYNPTSIKHVVHDNAQITSGQRLDKADKG